MLTMEIIKKALCSFFHVPQPFVGKTMIFWECSCGRKKSMEPLTDSKLEALKEVYPERFNKN